MPKPHRLNLNDLKVSTFEPASPTQPAANMNPGTQTECGGGLYTLDGANTCGATYCDAGTCWFECVTYVGIPCSA